MTDLINGTLSQELKLALEIILLLISNKKEDVRAYTLGNLYFLIDEESIQELIIKELKNISNQNSSDANKSAEYSLDSIAAKVHKFEIIKVLSDLNLEDLLLFNFKYLKSLKITPFHIFNTPLNIVNSEINVNTKLADIYKGFNSLLKKFCTSNQMKSIFSDLEEIEVFTKEQFLEHIIHYSDILELEYTPEDSLENLATIYAKTFREKGHLRRLKAFLDDDDHKIQQIGVNALTNVVNILLTISKKKKFSESINSSYNFYWEEPSLIKEKPII